MKASIFALALLVPAAAAAQDVSIAVGQPGRGYEARGLEIAERLKQRGLKAEVANYEGSDAISLAVCDGRATVGIMQIDAIYARAQEDCALKTVGTYGDEYAFILFPPDSRDDELSDLDAESRILVDTIGSGTELFWRNIVSIETGEYGNGSRWAEARPVYDLTVLADTLHKAGQIDAVIMVSTPQNAETAKLLENGWELGELYDKDINDMQFRGASLYEYEKVEIDVEGRWRDVRADAYVIPSFIAVRDDLQAEDRALYGAVVAAAQ